jgi:hypothetical protein
MICTIEEATRRRSLQSSSTIYDLTSCDGDATVVLLDECSKTVWVVSERRWVGTAGTGTQGR